ncbi:hypothetical protein CKO28_00610 [Rhodovibrio sodomensis]|uniref:Uncharacterized protein n=1 Tax=Rhodovibrio sodomensis TaxID=1088 RepID=A0ABS1D8U1_9PROT|nr:hypothetical protein [Rhodovibrio sodomensis]MBK1666542.1 hypothetical protein [Rhodovibrio sodomensis]
MKPLRYLTALGALCLGLLAVCAPARADEADNLACRYLDNDIHLDLLKNGVPDVKTVHTIMVGDETDSFFRRDELDAGMDAFWPPIWKMTDADLDALLDRFRACQEIIAEWGSPFPVIRKRQIDDFDRAMGLIKTFHERTMVARANARALNDWVTQLSEQELDIEAAEVAMNKARTLLAGEAQVANSYAFKQAKQLAEIANVAAQNTREKIDTLRSTRPDGLETMIEVREIIDAWETDVGRFDPNDPLAGPDIGYRGYQILARRDQVEENLEMWDVRMDIVAPYKGMEGARGIYELRKAIHYGDLASRIRRAGSQIRTYLPEAVVRSLVGMEEDYGEARCIDAFGEDGYKIMRRATLALGDDTRSMAKSFCRLLARGYTLESASTNPFEATLVRSHPDAHPFFGAEPPERVRLKLHQVEKTDDRRIYYLHPDSSRAPAGSDRAIQDWTNVYHDIMNTMISPHGPDVPPTYWPNNIR